jgi:hypothetical protein
VAVVEAAGGRVTDTEVIIPIRAAWIPERTFDNVLWHVTGLAPGEHDLRIVVRGDADERSRGVEVPIQLAVIYGRTAE